MSLLDLMAQKRFANMVVSYATNIDVSRESAKKPKHQINKRDDTQQSPSAMVRVLFPDELFDHHHQQSNEHDGGNDSTSGYGMDVTQAIRNNDVEALRLMLEKGQSFDVCNLNGEYLIHLACRRSDLATIQFLLADAGVNPNVKDKQGRTILHDACWRPAGAPELLSFLLGRVDPQYLTARDDRGFIPFDYVRRHDWRLWKVFCHVNLERILKRLDL